jgi:hypothetical protein
MNAFIYTVYRDLTCIAAAMLIALIVSAGFVQSTATAPGPYAAAAAHTVQA